MTYISENDPDLTPYKPEIHEKGWGHEQWIDNNDIYCGKILVMRAGEHSSWHYHKIKRETFYLASGKLVIHHSREDDLENADSFVMVEGECFRVPTGLRHRIEALEDSHLFEFSSSHKNRDSIRIEDDYPDISLRDIDK